ncbi:ABC transporter permease [Frondihabitans sp. PAMC 28766]|nr:ABC transporter permease [Frondihabitans sp. PAMC 28766]AMM22533.1 ABC transporter permease [Frondihabitans sp. PAMC 28766]
MVVPASETPGLAVTRTRSWKAPIALAVFTILSLLLVTAAHRDGHSTFRLASSSDFVKLPNAVLPTAGTGIVLTIVLALITVFAAQQSARYRKTPLWLLALFGVLFFVGFLTWAGADNSILVPGLLVGSLGLSCPLIFGALGGVISERVGVVNVAIEGQLLGGAFVSAIVASVTGSLWAGLLSALVAGALVSMVLAVFSIRYLVDQVIVGVVLNVLVTGLTSFFYSEVLTNSPGLNKGLRFSTLDIPGLSSIPLIGPLLFQQNIVVYLMYVAVAAVFFGLFKTRWGLRLRAVGEHPQAADTVGIRVNATRFWNVSLAGAIAGLGGAFFTLGDLGQFQKEMTAGAGYIALAAVIFGRWDPIRATLAALLFGFASNLQNVLSVVGSPVPSEFMLMLPYVVTILAVAGLVGQSRGPAASGKPYIKS